MKQPSQQTTGKYKKGEMQTVICSRQIYSKAQPLNRIAGKMVRAFVQQLHANDCICKHFSIFKVCKRQTETVLLAISGKLRALMEIQGTDCISGRKETALQS